MSCNPLPLDLSKYSETELTARWGELAARARSANPNLRAAIENTMRAYASEIDKRKSK